MPGKFGFRGNDVHRTIGPAPAPVGKTKYYLIEEMDFLRAEMSDYLNIAVPYRPYFEHTYGFSLLAGGVEAGPRLTKAIASASRTCGRSRMPTASRR